MAVARSSSDGVAIRYVLIIIIIHVYFRQKVHSFIDDVMFSCHAANGPESSTTLCVEEVRQVAVPFGRQTTTLFGYVR